MDSGHADSAHRPSPPSGEDEGGSFLVSPGLGLMIWTLLVFLFTMYVLSKVAFPRIQEALDKRANAIRESIERRRRQREEADEILAEYRARLKEAREQADDIVARARKAAETAERRGDRRRASEKREELLAAARRDIEAETRRSLERIRKEVADLTVLTTEKVTRKTLDCRGPEAADRGGAGRGRLLQPRRRQRRGPRGASGAKLDGGDRPRIRRRRCSGRRRSKGKLDAIREQLGQFADALDENRELQLFFFSPYFSSAEKERRPEERGRGRRAGAAQLPRAADREAPDAGDLPDPPPVRRALGRRRTSGST